MGKWRYGVILDAGSSGTRVYVYKWLNNARARKDASKDELRALPELITHKKWTKKIHPGVSTFGAKPESVGPDHLAPLLEHALKYVPKHEIENTPFFLLATAGMRLLPDNQRNDVLREICSYVGENTKFQLPDCDLHIQVIPGETEGLYGWIAANYLLGGFNQPELHDHGKGHHTYGFLDMGGASAQIAFAPNATEAEKHANDLRLLRLRTVGGGVEEYRVFVTTWLGFGANEARRRYVKALEDSTDPDIVELPDPCLPIGLNVTESGKTIEPGSDEYLGRKPHLLGTGEFPECLRQTYPLLEKDAPCPDKPCLINGQHVPAIDFDVNHFVGVSEYWHTTHEVFEMSHDDKAYDFHTYQDRVNQFCSQPWSDIEKGLEKQKWGKKVDQKTALEVCFKASWLINMLHEGIGIPRIGIEKLNGHNGHNVTKAIIDSAKEKGFLDPFQAVDKIHDVEVSWTLGKMVLYASSQIPSSSDNSLPVGFGSNIPGIAIPTDFQRPGGNSVELPDDLLEGAESANPDLPDPDADADWHDTLFHDSPRRIPGLILFLVIIIFALCLLCGRERRANMWNRFRTALGLSKQPRRGRFGAGRLSKFLGHRDHTPAYERLGVLEAGGHSDTVGEFELPPYDSDDENQHSDDSEGVSSSRAGTGKTRGWATPTLTVGTVEHGSPSKRGYLSGSDAASMGREHHAGLGLISPGLAAMERSGLQSRTDSRERLGQRLGSRPASPRGRSPALGFKEALD